MGDRLELLAELDARLALFSRLSEFNQWAIDRNRWVPTAEMHDILGHYIKHGRFYEDHSRGWSTLCVLC